MLQKRSTVIWSALLLSGLLASLANSVAAAIITLETATASSKNDFVNTFPIHAVDNSGLNGDAPAPGGHDRANPNYDNAWLSRTTAQGGDADPWFLVDLGAVYDITSFHVWNYNEGGGNSSHGITAADITYSTSNAAGTGNLLGTFPFSMAIGDPTWAGENFNETFTARYIRFEIVDSYDTQLATGNTAYGLSEVQFTGTLIPEPSTFALAGLGLVGMVSTARRRRGQS